MRTKLVKGMKYDAGKPRWDLLPMGPIEELVDVIGFGVKKYAPNSWQKVDNFEERYYAALMRHIVAYRKFVKNPEKYSEKAKDSKLRHLAHALCNIVFLMEGPSK